MDADEESKKPEGMAATAKIKGTVDTSQRPTSGQKSTGDVDEGKDDSEEDKDDKSDN